MQYSLMIRLRGGGGGEAAVYRCLLWVSMLALLFGTLYWILTIGDSLYWYAIGDMTFLRSHIIM